MLKNSLPEEPNIRYEKPELIPVDSLHDSFAKGDCIEIDPWESIEDDLGW